MGSRLTRWGGVELRGGQTQPLAQTLAAGIVKRNAAGMHFAPGCLPGDHDAGAAARLYHRAWAQWQVGCTQGAGPYAAQQGVQILFWWGDVVRIHNGQV